jgi:hypothetical protein
MTDDDFLGKYNITVEPGEVEVGKTYPLYGIVTNIIDDTFENYTIEINHSITLRCFLKSEESSDIIKERAFEPGIFITKITNSNPVEGECETIVFGKKSKDHLA